jgi:hypothetical protein
MAEHKQDTSVAGSMATGSHRAWVGEKRVTDNGVAPARATTREPLRPFAARPMNGKPNARHAAITKSLAHFPSYKTWAEKTKANWEDKPE